MFAIDLGTPNPLGWGGCQRDEEEFIKEAVNTLLAARKDLRVSIACELYKKEEISLGKACEIASLNIEEMKEVLHKRGIRRSVNVSSEERERMVKKAIEPNNSITTPQPPASRRAVHSCNT